jgi:hypothetical protein
MVTRLIRIGADWNYEVNIMNTSDVLTGGQFVLFTSNNNNWFKIDYGNTKTALKTISFYKNLSQLQKWQYSWCPYHHIVET